MLAHGQQVSAMVDEMDLGAGLGVCDDRWP
jgi:hypothetical protein